MQLDWNLFFLDKDLVPVWKSGRVAPICFNTLTRHENFWAWVRNRQTLNLLCLPVADHIPPFSPSVFVVSGPSFPSRPFSLSLSPRPFWIILEPARSFAAAFALLTILWYKEYSVVKGPHFSPLIEHFIQKVVIICCISSPIYSFNPRISQGFSD